MAAGDIRIALNGKFYYGTAGSPAATEQTNVDDVSLQITKRVAERIRRGKRLVTKKPTVHEIKLSFKVLDVEGDGLMALLETNAMNDTPMAFYPRDTATGKGMDADFYITSLTRAEPNAEFIGFEVEAEATDEQRDPSYH